MTPAERATALALAVAAAVISFALGATVAYLLTSREPAPRPQRPRRRSVAAHRHRLAPRHRWLKVAAAFTVLFLAFSVVMGATA